MTTIRIGAGAGYSGDRIEPAVELAEQGGLDYLVFECLAERTIALAHLRRLRAAQAGYDPLLERRMRAVLPAARRGGVRIITNMGAANPLAAMNATVAVARELGLHGLKVAAVTGDDVKHVVSTQDLPLDDGERTSADIEDRIISANAYLGAGPIVTALERGADVVVTGRVGDPAMFLAPMIHAFGWQEDDWTCLGRGTMIGHLLECAGQLTGGYFAVPGLTEVPGLARLGFPYADVSADGSAVLSKVAGSGGLLTVDTCKEQLLYEVFDPSAYLQADVTADFSTARFDQIGKDTVAVSGGGGRERPARLKVSVGYHDGFIGEGQISYAGPYCEKRGRLALDIVRERLQLTGLSPSELDLSLIGIDAASRTGRGGEPAEVRARVAGRTVTRDHAAAIGAEVEALYTNGPAGGGGSDSRVREVVAVASTFIDRHIIQPSVVMEVC